ncbi:MAG: NADH:flavin oxidoreductase [Candidatus Aminicenantes bacterium]|nr:NADH:flavin oxidoreductase [Candidatus Aminicenantes bacterium]
MSVPNAPSVLFTPMNIGSVTVPNRFVRSATHEFMAEEDGRMTKRHLELFGGLAEGEVGLIISGHAYVNRRGIASPGQTGIYDDRLVEHMRGIPEAVHRTPAKIFLQIAHAGRQTKERLIGGTPVAPSAVPDPVFKVVPREMTPEEIRGLIRDFVQAARRALEAGFDGVQIHAAHGYLLSSFLSPHTNRRTDEWGGTAENRARVVVEILRGIRDALGRAFPVIIKINSTDFLPTGLTLAEAIAAARILEPLGLDAVEVSGGMTESGRGSVWPGLRTEDEEGYFVGPASEFKAALKIPVIGLGGNRTFSVMERFVREGRVDFISLSRPFVREPDLVRRFRLGLSTRSGCVSCNKCFNPRGLACGDLKKHPSPG